VNVIGAQRIDGNEKNISMRRLVQHSLPGDASVSNQTATEEDGNNPHWIERIIASIAHSASMRLTS
jgi:hypothetical protein